MEESAATKTRRCHKVTKGTKGHEEDEGEKGFGVFFVQLCVLCDFVAAFSFFASDVRRFRLLADEEEDDGERHGDGDARTPGQGGDAEGDEQPRAAEAGYGCLLYTSPSPRD